MKYLKAFLLLVLILSAGNGFAQPFKVLKATSQRWVGGVVGHMGINYQIEIEASQKKLIPDTLWINGEVYPIDFHSSFGNCKRTYDSLTGETVYSILVAESHNDMHRGRPHPDNDTATEKPKPPRIFDGTALISYTVNSSHKNSGRHKRHFFTIKSFTQLQTLNYP